MTTELDAIAFDINALLIKDESVLWEHFTKVDPPFHIKNLLIYLPWKGLLSIILSVSFLVVARITFKFPLDDIYSFILFLAGVTFLFMYPLWDFSDFIANYTTRSKKLKFLEIQYYLTNLRLIAMQYNGLEARSYFLQNWEMVKANKKNQTLEFGSLTKPLVLYNVEDPEVLQKLILEQIAKKQ